MDWAQAVPPASLRWAQDAAGARVVAALPLDSQWLANHLLVLADGRELVLRRWARPGWEVDDPDLTAAREVLVLERLADTPVPAPELVAADPDAAACDVAALLITRVPGAAIAGRPPLGPLAAALAEIHAVDPAGIPPYRRYYEPERLAVPTWAADRDVWERAIALSPTSRRRCCPSASSIATSIPATLCGRARSSPASSTGRRARAGRARSTSGTCAGTSWLDHGQRVADALLPHPEHHPYYDVVTVLDVLPELDPTDTHAELLRLEDHVARALAAL